MLRAIRLILPAFCLLALPVQAAVFTVTKTADSFDGVCDHDCSLREAVSAANLALPTDDADVVVVPAGVYELTRLGAGEDLNNSGDLDVNRRMILVGAGAGSTILSGKGFDRVLDVRAPAEIFGVTIREGRVDGDGGGILVRPGSPLGPPAVLQRSVVAGNLAQNGGDGGGIAAFGSLEIRDSAILDNQAEGDGGGIGAGESGSFSLRNVTVSGNRAAGSGGGLDYPEDNVAPISGSTIVFNQAQVSGGGIHARGNPLFPATAEHVFGSIVAENFAPLDRDCASTWKISAGYNVFGTPGCGAEPTDRSGTAQSPLQVVFRLPRTDLGPTPVHEPLLGSPALDLVAARFCEPADQVGQARSAPCDAGALEKAGHPVCIPGGAILCLQDGRFRASAVWALDEQESTPASALPLTDDTGLYWFFGADNLEVMVKVLDGCALNGHWWFFSSGLTDVGVALRVEDLKTGRIREHVQPPGRTYGPRLDTEAFPCDLPDESATAGSAPDLAPAPLSSVLVVTKTADSDDGACGWDCSLREAVLEANLRGGTRVIVLGPGVHTLSIPGRDEDLGHTGDLDVNGHLVILGAGAPRTVIDGGGLDRVLDVSGSLELHGVTVSGGWARPEDDPFRPGSGGGIQSFSSLVLVRSVVRSNRADHEGGGIASYGWALAVQDSTVSGNVAGTSGGGIAAEEVDLENVTLSGNQAGDAGGGLFWYNPPALRNVTIVGNAARFGGGMSFGQICHILCLPVTFDMQRTVIAGNAGTFEVGGDCDVPPHTGGYNVFGVGDGCNPLGTDRSGTPAHPLDPRLTPLGDHGGPTPTHALLPGSPAIDLAPASLCQGADQRGRPRPADGDGDGSALCDAGAVERGPACQPDAETLCLDAGDRFRVTARWNLTAESSGPGIAVPLAADTGAFWFFDPANVELMVKVLDGCGLNGHHWVFVSGLTDVGVQVFVEDTRTGNTYQLGRVGGTPLQPVLDTAALQCVNP